MQADDALLTAKISLQDQVVHRQFEAETVVLHLQTGQYYGLNATASRMLEVLEQQPTVADAVAQLAQEYEHPADEIRQDALGLCRELLDRELIAVTPAGG